MRQQYAVDGDGLQIRSAQLGIGQAVGPREQRGAGARQQGLGTSISGSTEDLVADPGGAQGILGAGQMSVLLQCGEYRLDQRQRRLRLVPEMGEMGALRVQLDHGPGPQAIFAQLQGVLEARLGRIEFPQSSLCLGQVALGVRQIANVIISLGEDLARHEVSLSFEHLIRPLERQLEAILEGLDGLVKVGANA